MKERKTRVGTRVRYQDQANPYHEGTVENIYTDRWGTFVEILWDQEYIETGIVLSPVSTIAIYTFDGMEATPWGGNKGSWGVIDY